VTYLVCKIVTTIIGIVVEFVLKAITRIVAIIVCLFTDPLKALSALWDLLNDVIDFVDDVLELVVSLLDDVAEILHEVGDFLAAIGRTFCIFGDVFCVIFSAIFGALEGLADWLADIVDLVRDTVEGVRDVLVGLLSLDWCRIQQGLGIGNILRIITSVLRLPGMLFYVGPRGLIEKRDLESIMDKAMGAAFGDDGGRLERSRTRSGIGGSPLGVPMTLDPRRMAIPSGRFLRDLHNTGVLDLYALVGRFTNCQGKTAWDQFKGEVVYTGTRLTVTKTDIDDFLANGSEAVPPFTVYSITRDTLRNRLKLTKRKGLQLGIHFSWSPIGEINISDPRFIPLASDETGDTVQRDLLRVMGRPDVNEDLSVVPFIAIFGYVKGGLHGLTVVVPSAQKGSEPNGNNIPRQVSGYDIPICAAA